MKKYLLPFLFLSVFSIAAQAQSPMAGNYTVGSAVTDSFSTVVACVDSLEARGVSGPVTIKISAGTYTGQLSFTSISGASAINTITFQGVGSSSVIRHTPNTSNRAVISINGTSHLIFDSLKVQAAGSYGIGFNLLGQADSLSILNCYILLPNVSSANACTGIANFSSNNGTGTSFVKNITVKNDSIEGGFIGIRLNGDATNDNLMKIEDNTIFDFGSIGIMASSSMNSQFNGNKVSSSSADAKNAISMWPTGKRITISNNIFELGSKVIHTRVMQIAGAPGSGGSNWSTQVLISNNMVRYFGTQSGNISGIYTKHVNYMKIYNNTVLMSTGSGAVSLWLDALSSTGNINVKNNNLSNSVSNGILFRVHGQNTLLDVDYNNYHNPSGMKITWKGTTHTTLPAYRTGSSQGANSVSLDPKFVSTTDLHVDSTNAKFDGYGTYISEVAKDFDGETRDATFSDIGADEFDSKADVAAGNLAIPGNCLKTGSTVSFTFWIKNEGPYSISDVPISYQVNNGVPVEQTYTGTIASGDSVQYTFNASSGFSSSGLYHVKAFTRLRADQERGNDTSNTASVAISDLFINMTDSVGICLGEDVEVETKTPSSTKTFLWTNGSSLSTLDLDAVDISLGRTVYGLTIKDANDCQVQDSVTIVASQAAITNLGNDTSLCPGESVVIGQNISAGKYLWHDNSTNKTITARSVGFYKVDVNTGYGCTVRDSVRVGYYFDPILNLQNAAVICRGDSLVLDPGDFATYTWDDQSTASTRAVYDDGKYWVDIVDHNGCPGSDTLTLYLNESPDVDLGGDTVLCEGGSLTFDVSRNWHTYKWHDGSTVPVFTVTEAGKYWVAVTNGNNCTITDTIQVSEVSGPSVALGNDTVVCAGTGFALMVSGSSLTYRWHDMSTESSLEVKESGDYSVEVANGDGCKSRDTINVSVNPQPDISLGKDTLIGQGRLKDIPLRLEVKSGYKSYRWSNGSDENYIELDGTTPLGTHEHSIVVTNEFDCATYDTVVVEVFDNASIGNLSYYKLSVYPNPASSDLTIQLDGVNENLDLEMHDMFGRVVLEKRLIMAGNSISQTIGVGNLASGTYILTLRGESDVKSLRVTIK